MRTDARDDLRWTTDVPDLPGVDPADPPTEMVPGRLWHGGCPVDYRWVAAAEVDVVVDLSDPNTVAPPTHLDARRTYLKCPLADTDTIPDPQLTCGLAALVADLVRSGRRVLVHCTFGRNRSGLLVTLVVRDLLELSGRDARRYVQQRRRRAVNNATFAAWLNQLPPPSPAAGGRHSGRYQ